VPVGEGEPDVDELCDTRDEPLTESVCVDDPDIDAMAVDVMLLRGLLLVEGEIDGLPEVLGECEADPVVEPVRETDADDVDDKHNVPEGETLLVTLADGVTDGDAERDTIEGVDVTELVVDPDFEGSVVTELDIVLDGVRDTMGDLDTVVDADSEARDADAVTE